MKAQFSILILINTLDNNNINNIISNIKKGGCFQKTEILLLNNSQETNTDELTPILENNSNIVLIDVNGKEKAEAYNIGIDNAKGIYISFIEDDVTYSKNAIEKVYKYIKTKPHLKLVSFKPYQVSEEKIKPYKMSPTKCETVDLNFMPMKLNLALDSYFIHKKLVRKFDETLLFEDAKMKFLLEILMKYPLYHFLKNVPIYYKTPKEDDVAVGNMEKEKRWYNDSLKEFVIPFLEKIKSYNNEVPLYLQEAILYYIFVKYNCNINDRNKMVLSKDEAKEFFASTITVMQYIDDNLIMRFDKNSLYQIPKWLSYQFIAEKNKKLNQIIEVKIEENKVFLSNETKNEEYMLKSNKKPAYAEIKAISYRKQKLEIDFIVGLEYCLDREKIEAGVTYNEKDIVAKKNNCYPLLKVFGMTIAKKIPFHISIPLNEEKAQGKIKFYFIYQEQRIELKVKIMTPQAHLNNSRFSYWKFDKYYYLCNKKRYLEIERKYLLMGQQKEITYFLAKMYVSKHKISTLKWFGLRFLYWCIKPFYKGKQVWISYDKLYKGGDNGEYIYRYIKDNHKEVKMYYIINKNSLDYTRLRNEPNAHILVYGSLKHRLMSLLSTAILATHANAISYCGFNIKRNKMDICDLFNPDIICIQHGLTIQKIAQYQNRLVDNIALYCCASKYEITNMLYDDLYGYTKDMLKLTGLARYDGLRNNDKRQILITPTWRRYLTLPSPKYGEARRHNDEFKNSIYFKIYNNLINDKELINVAQKYNYKIIFLLHPCTSSQINDYDKNDFVELIAATDNMNYEKILTESSLMVTDYSGIQFDFAYMRKPIVYYHPDELPPHYEAGGLEYETMGFGPICKSHKEIVKTLCNYMENNCKTEKEYVKRADDFFAFNDFNNCERIYNAIIEYMKERK